MGMLTMVMMVPASMGAKVSPAALKERGRKMRSTAGWARAIMAAEPRREKATRRETERLTAEAKLANWLRPKSEAKKGIEAAPAAWPMMAMGAVKRRLA